MSTDKILGTRRIIPVLAFHSTEEALLTAQALVDGGVNRLEVTLRTPVALDSVSAIAENISDAVVGVGTVLKPEQLIAAKRAGARFAISPGLTESLAECVADQQFPFIPGVATVSEAMRARELGFNLLKFFPAEQSGGAAFLKSVSSVLPDISFCPTGGVNPDNARSYLDLPNVRAIGGSWLVKRHENGTIDCDATLAAAKESQRL